MDSIQPVFHSQPRHLSEVTEVPGQQYRIMNEADRSDLEIHRSCPEFERSEGVKRLGRFFIKGKDRHSGDRINALLEVAISPDLVWTSFIPANQGNPTLEGFFHDNDAGENVRLMKLNLLSQTFSEGSAVGEFPEVVGVKNDKHQPSARRFISCRHAAPSFAASSTKGSSCMEPKIRSADVAATGFRVLRDGNFAKKSIIDLFAPRSAVFLSDLAEFPLI